MSNKIVTLVMAQAQAEAVSWAIAFGIEDRRESLKNPKEAAHYTPDELGRMDAALALAKIAGDTIEAQLK